MIITQLLLNNVGYELTWDFYEVIVDKAEVEF